MHVHSIEKYHSYHRKTLRDGHVPSTDLIEVYTRRVNPRPLHQGGLPGPPLWARMGWWPPRPPLARA
eukprot:SAG11_NODE_30060_length_304_cov_1.273171_1_plen_66_part_01